VRGSTLHRLPPTLQSYLEDSTGLMASDQMTAELVAVLHAAKQTGIDVVPLKGSVLSLIITKNQV
jgi:hypothetical protein